MTHDTLQPDGSIAAAAVALTPSQQHSALAYITQTYAAWKTARQPLETKWQECWNAYLCTVAPNSALDSTSADRSRVARPVLYESVESIHAHLLNALFPADEHFFSVVGRTEADQAHANTIESYLRNKLQTLGFYEQYALFLKQAIITGSSIAAVPWLQQRKRRRVQQPITMLGATLGYRTEWQNVLTYNGPSFDVVDLFDVVMDPSACKFEDATLIRRLEKPLHQLKQNPNYSNLDQLTPKAPQMDAHKTARKQAVGLQSNLQSNANDTIELLEVWGDIWIDGTVYQNMVAVVANGERLIRFEENPYDHGQKPFVFTNLIPIPNELYGIGAIEKCLGLQHTINTLTNQKLDVINLSINNPFTYLINDDVFDPNTLVTRPGALIPVKSHDTLRPIQYLNNFTVAFTEIADLKAEVQEATGALKYFTGAEGGNGNRTATEISALVSGGAQKFNHFIAHLENTSLEPFLEQVLENAKQFLQQPETLRVSRDDGSLQFLDILPDVLRQAECTFRIDGSASIAAEGQELDSIVRFINMVQQYPTLRDKVDVLPLLKKVYRRLGFKDEDQIFTANGGLNTLESA